MSGRKGAASVMESRIMERVMEFVHVTRIFVSLSSAVFSLTFTVLVSSSGLVAQGFRLMHTQGLEREPRSADGVDLVPGLRHCIGNMVNGVVFGRTYAFDDPTWKWLQHLLDEGVRLVAVAGPINFLPVLRFSVSL